MLKNLLELPDGTKLFSGSATENAVKSVTLTQCVNSEDELTLGSTCANMLEATLITPNGGLSLTAGDEVTLYKVDDANTLRKVGVFALEKPTRPTAHTMKLTGYDRVTKLDKDLTEWLKGLTGWPYNILTFAEMVCEACGLSFIRSDVPNSDYSVESFSITGVTGRQIMKWIGEVCCCFVRANSDGNIEMGWYKPLTTHAIGYKEGCYISVSDDGAGTVSIDGIDVQSDSDANGNVTVVSDRITVSYDEQGNVDLTIQNLDTFVYFQNGLSYEEYDVAPVDAVQIQLADGDNAYRWPAADDGANCYVISGNPMLNSTTDTVKRALQTICAQLEKINYTPCKVSLPAVLDIQAGHIVRIVDKNKKSITMLVMTKKTTGQKDTYECTGSHRRDSTTAQNNQSAGSIAQHKVDALTQEDIFNKLTNGGKAQGVFLKDGQLYINANYLATGVLTSANGKIQIDLSGENLPIFNTGISTNGIIVRGDEVGAKELVTISVDKINGQNTAAFCMSDIEGKPFCSIAEDVSATGGGIRIENNAGTLSARMQSTTGSAGFVLDHAGKVKGFLGITEEGYSATQCDAVVSRTVTCDELNPGKKVLYSGSVSVDEKFSVPNTSNYDLFAILLGNDSGATAIAVLSYKISGVIRGVGGWCGTRGENAYSRQLFYVSATHDGDTWMLVDAGYNNISTDGVLSAGVRLKIKKIIGII